MTDSTDQHRIAYDQAVARAKRAINPLVQAAEKTSFQCPVAVWDNAGELIGIIIEAEIEMGGKPCICEASFTLNMNDPDTVMRLKAQAAMDTIKHRILSKIFAKREA